MDGTCDDDAYEWTDWWNSDVNPYINGTIPESRRTRDGTRTNIPSQLAAYLSFGKKGNNNFYIPVEGRGFEYFFSADRWKSR